MCFNLNLSLSLDLTFDCRSGGIGRHAILRGWWVIPVGVQIPPSAPSEEQEEER